MKIKINRKLTSFLVLFLFVLLAIFVFRQDVSWLGKNEELARAPEGKSFPIFGAWVCDSQPYNCTWSDPITAADLATGGSFDKKYHWIIDRDPSSAVGKPSLNLVVLAFINPLELMDKFNSASVVEGIPVGMNQEVINYFKSRGVRVMLAIGGIAYNEDWNIALETNPKQLGTNAALAAQKLGVGIEINYEDPEVTTTRMNQLEQFITAYRSVHPYDPLGNNPAARLTIDLPISNRFLKVLDEWATKRWLQKDSDPKMKLDYANSLVADRQFESTEYQMHWQENLDGSPGFTPPILSQSPAKFTVSLFLEDSKKLFDECTNFQKSLLRYSETGKFVLDKELLGYMFWAVGNPIGNISTYPPHTCEKGLGAAASFYQIPVPMPSLRQP
jgi:hypothetical protein